MSNLSINFDSSEAALDAARSTETDPTVLAELADHDSEDVREAVAGNPNTPATALTQLANENDVYWDLAQVILTNPKAPTEALDEIEIWTDSFGIEEEGDLGVAILSHPNVSYQTLEHNAEYGFTTARRCAVAGNPKTPADLLAVVAYWTPDEDETTVTDEEAAEAATEVRQVVAFNPNTPADLLSNLAEDEAAQVRRAVSENLNTPISLLYKLAEDYDKHVAKSARATLNRLIKV